MSKIARRFLESIVNTVAFKTTRKVISICSDDWGSLRLKDERAREQLILNGVRLNLNRFDQFDCLESEEDLEMLFEVLSKYRDYRGNNPVITALTNVANPDFKKIKDAGFSRYFYQPFTDALQRYPSREGVYNLYLEGISKRLFIPQFHGREHLQVSSWLRGLQANDPKTLLSFNHEFFFLNKDDVHIDRLAGEYAEAFNFWDKSEIEIHKESITTGTDLFQRLFGYRASFFTAPVLLYHPALNRTLANCGITILDSARLRREPLGKNKSRRRFCYTGQKNMLGQRYINRNAVFEPNLSGAGVEQCMAQIEIIFGSQRPVIISNHRASFVGGINERNRKEGIQQLDRLLRKIIDKWPEVEFVDVNGLSKMMDEHD